MSRKKTIAMATSAPSRAPNCPLVIMADLQQSVPIGPTPASDRGSSHARSRAHASTATSNAQRTATAGPGHGPYQRPSFAPRYKGKLDVYWGPQSGGVTMKLALITLGLLATTGVVYAACVFC
jgi:hypothetical protein